MTTLSIQQHAILHSGSPFPCPSSNLSLLAAFLSSHVRFRVIFSFRLLRWTGTVRWAQFWLEAEMFSSSPFHHLTLLFVTPELPAWAHSPISSVVLRNCQLHQLHFRCFVKGWNSSPSHAILFLGPLESCQGKWRWHEHVHFGFVFQGWVKWWTGLFTREREGKGWAAHIGWSWESVGNEPEKKDPSDWKFESLNALEPTASYRISVFSDLLWVSAMVVWATGQIVNQNEQGLFMASVVHRLY